MSSHKQEETNIDIITLDVEDFVSPECSCRLEDMINKVEGVIDSSFNPINNILQVKVQKGKVSYKNIESILKQSAVTSQKRTTSHETSHTEHEAMKMKKQGKPAKHDHHAMMEAEMKKRFIVSLMITIPVLTLSPTIQRWIGFSVPEFTGSDILLSVLATAIVVYGGLVFYRGAFKSLKLRAFDMNTLVSIAVLSGFLYSLGATFLFEAADFYWEISTLVVFLLFGHWMEMKAIRGASGALNELVKLIPPMANRFKNGEIDEVPTSEVRVGDILLVRPGEKVPIDGVVVEGETTLNEAMITGESKPVNKKKGEEVIGGTINGEGSIRIKIAKTGEDTALGQIITMVQNAQSSKPKIQKLADRAAHYLTIIAIVFGVGTFVFWRGVAGAEPVFALTLTITVIIIACPHALGLAIPTVTSIATTMAARKGMLVKNADALELAKGLDIIVFDKTGTLTKGEFGVTDMMVVGGWSEGRILATASAIEQNSEHVIAKGIVKKAKAKSLETKKATKFLSIPGKGAKAIVDSEEIYVGNANLIRSLGIDLESHEKRVSELSAQGKTVVYLASKNGLKGLIALADLIREESREVVATLKQIGVKAAMLTGDNKKTAEYVAKELGIDTFFADVLPEQKAEKIKELQNQGMKVAMVGDGINDAPALTQADVGIAIGTGTDVAVESADIVLIKNDLRDVSKLVKLSKATMRKMRENIFWATGYNAFALPVAAGVLMPFNILLRPEWAALFMTASSIIVVTNAMLLKREKL